MSELRIILLISILLCSSLAFAARLIIPSEQSGVLLSLFGGGNWMTSGNNNDSVTFNELQKNVYIGNKSSAATSIVGFDVGYYQTFCARMLFVATGAEFNYTNVTSPQGTVKQLFLNSSVFDTLRYNYQARSMPLFWMGAIGTQLAGLKLYLIEGIGVSWNQAFNYQEVPTNPNGRTFPMRSMFQSLTKTAFAWSVGIGLGMRILPFTMVSLEYRYTDYGSLGLNPTLVQGTTQGLDLGKVTSNTLMLRIVLG